MKKFGDVVVLQSGKDVVKALVVCSIDRDGEEHLTLVYLHPSKDVGSFSGTQLDAAISKAFDVAPWKEGAQSGWYPQVQQPAIEEASEFSEDDGILGCAVKVVLTPKDVLLFVGGRDHQWNRATGKHVGAGILLCAPTPSVVNSPSVTAKAAPLPTLPPEDAQNLAQLSGSGGLAGDAESRIAEMYTIKLPPELATLPGIAGIGSQYAEPDMVIPPNPPSADDLDKVADEQKAKEATAEAPEIVFTDTMAAPSDSTVKVIAEQSLGTDQPQATPEG